MFRRIALGLVVGVLSATAVFAQAPPAPAQAATPVSNARLFAADAGMVLNFIKPDKTADFESVMAKLKEAGLVESEKRGIWVYYRLRDKLPTATRKLLSQLIA